ncbi:hypothetical protein ACA910_008294 [Epithemia clementina (nom. ined.)]
MVLDDETTFIGTWYITGIASFGFPLLLFFNERLGQRRNQDYYNNGGNGGQNNNWNDGQNGGNDGNQWNGQQTSCGWWQGWCGGNRDGNQQQGGIPWWWVFGGEDIPDDERTSPALKFIYIWSLVIFFLILHFGAKAVIRGSIYATVLALTVFANLALLSLFYICGLDAIDLEGEGWYGQLGILMFLTNLFWLIFCTSFAIILVMPSEERRPS